MNNTRIIHATGIQRVEQVNADARVPKTDFPKWLIDREQDILRWQLEREIDVPIDDPHDFARHAHQVIQRRINHQKAADKPFDYLGVKAALEKHGELETVGAPYLLELSRDSVRPSDAAILSAVEEIKAAARTRRSRAILNRHANAERIDIDLLASDLDALRGGHREAPPLHDDAAVLNLPEPARIVDGRVYERSLAMLMGDSGIGKTFLAIGLGLSVASGLSSWLGASITKRGPVVYVAAEGAPGRRIGAWKVAHGFGLDTPVGLHTWSGVVSLLEPAEVSAFIAAVKPLRPVLVIVDTLARCLLGGDENSARDMGLAIASLDRIRVQLDATVLVLHHTNKAGTSERGSGALRGACDTVLYLQHADDLLQLACSKDKDAEPFEPVNLKLVPAYPDAPTCIVRLADEVMTTDALSDAQGRALHALRELFGDLGATSDEWHAALPTMARATFYHARKKLMEKGYVRQSKSRRFLCTEKATPSNARPMRLVQAS